VGASGAILGFMGFRAHVRKQACGARARRRAAHRWIDVGLTALLGVAVAEIDNAAHAGGLVAVRSSVRCGRAASDPFLPARAPRALAWLGWASALGLVAGAAARAVRIAGLTDLVRGAGMSPSRAWRQGKKRARSSTGFALCAVHPCASRAHLRGGVRGEAVADPSFHRLVHDLALLPSLGVCGW